MAAMKECGWGMWEAYQARLKYGLDGYFRNRTYPSWGPEAKPNASVASTVSCVQHGLGADPKIIAPEDVIYRTVAALFGFWGLDMPATTADSRHVARRELRELRRDKKEYLENEDMDEEISDTESNEDQYAKRYDTRNPRYIPRAISGACREDCLIYVRSLAYHYVLSTLVKRVSRWEKSRIVRRVRWQGESRGMGKGSRQKGSEVKVNKVSSSYDGYKNLADDAEDDVEDEREDEVVNVTTIT
jgi:hypothetical protein